MKLILSRKGFDSSAGGYPSPHFVENGRLLSLPIPEDNNNGIDTGKTYADLKFDVKQSYLDVMDELGLRNFKNKFVHLDPDIYGPTISYRDHDWRGIFGQSSAAQSHLNNKGVEPGDLFLFFGWFRDVIKTREGYKYVGGTDRHIIWGYLQVGEIESIKLDREYESWKSSHPHYYYRNRESNTVYIANTTLSFANSLPGHGLFNFRETLVLTCPGQDKRSVWKFPKCLHPTSGTRLSYHEKLSRWQLKKSHCTLNSVGRGQEFVIQGNNEVIEWAKKLFK